MQLSMYVVVFDLSSVHFMLDLSDQRIASVHATANNACFLDFLSQVSPK